MPESISHGHDEWNNLELAGRTVRQALDQYRDVFNLPDNAPVEINGHSVRSDYVIQAGDRVEVVRETGQKGWRFIAV
jgi:sulfur carrier protein ThiS